MPCDLRGVEKTAPYELRASLREKVHEKYGEKTHQRSRDGVEQVFQRRGDGLLRHFLQHHRHGEKRQHLKAEIERQEISREAHGNERPEGQEIKGKKHSGALFPFHVLKGVEADRGVKQKYRGEKENAHVIGRKGHVQVLGERQERDASALQRRRGAEQIRRQYACPEAPVSCADLHSGNTDKCSRERREKTRKDHQHCAASLQLLFQNISSPLRIRSIYSQETSPRDRFMAVRTSMGTV